MYEQRQWLFEAPFTQADLLQMEFLFEDAFIEGKEKRGNGGGDGRTPGELLVAANIKINMALGLLTNPDPKTTLKPKPVMDLVKGAISDIRLAEDRWRQLWGTRPHVRINPDSKKNLNNAFQFLETNKIVQSVAELQKASSNIVQAIRFINTKKTPNKS